MTGIPITIGDRPAKFFFGLSIRLKPDNERENLMVESSVVILSIAEDVDDDKNVLLHSDYERNKPDDYPEAHLHVRASSEGWDSITRTN